jgi:hypothetical protein
MTERRRLLLDLARFARGAAVPYRDALVRVFGVRPETNRRGLIAFDSTDPAVHSARVRLSRDLVALEGAGLICRDRNGYRLLVGDGE